MGGGVLCQSVIYTPSTNKVTIWPQMRASGKDDHKFIFIGTNDFTGKIWAEVQGTPCFDGYSGSMLPHFK